MARSRNIKPSFFTNEDLAELPFATRLLFIGLWTLADREGRLEDRPKKIKMAIFPGDNIDVDTALQELQGAGFIQRYPGAGGKYIQVLAFEKHQNPHFKEAASIIPKPGADTPLNEVQASGSPGFAGGGVKGGEPEANPGRAGLIPDSGFSDSLQTPLSGAAQPDAAAKAGKARAKPGAVLPEGFEAFWQSYPRKDAKQAAMKAWTKVKPAEHQAVMAGLELAKRSKQWLKDDGEFIPLPASWLNGRRWEDGGAQIAELHKQKTIHVMVDFKAGGRSTVNSYVAPIAMSIDPWDCVVRTARNPELRVKLLDILVGAVLVVVDKEPGIKGRYSPAEVREGLRKAA